MKKTENIKVRLSQERGHADHGWLRSLHSFSFADYYDPDYMGFRSLRVINEDYVEPGRGFGTHPHKDMEIITYVFTGTLQHKDSMGNGSIIKRGDIQKMSAGSGVTHSEFNPSDKEKVHLLQIWIVPQEKNLKPSYQQITYDHNVQKNALILMGSDKAQPNVIFIHQDVQLYRGIVLKDEFLEYKIDEGRGVWIQLIQGKLDLNGNSLQAGDAACIENINALRFAAGEDCEFLLFDLGQ